MKYLLTALLGFLVITSCDNAKKYEIEIAEIDSKQLQLDSLESVINAVNMDSLSYMQNEATVNEGVIRKYYFVDTIDMVFAGKLDKNKRVRKSLNGIELQKSKLLKELVEIRLQFTNLKTDVISGVYDREQIENYLNVERLDFNQLRLNVKNFNLLQEEQKMNFYYSNAQIKEYCEILLKDIEK